MCKMKSTSQIDVLDMLQEMNDYVKLVLTSGEIIIGLPHCIVYDEDEDGWETIKYIKFDPWKGQHSRFFKEEEIESFEEWKASKLTSANDEKAPE